MSQQGIHRIGIQSIFAEVAVFLIAFQQTLSFKKTSDTFGKSVRVFYTGISQ